MLIRKDSSGSFLNPHFLPPFPFHSSIMSSPLFSFPLSPSPHSCLVLTLVSPLLSSHPHSHHTRPHHLHTNHTALAQSHITLTPLLYSHTLTHYSRTRMLFKHKHTHHRAFTLHKTRDTHHVRTHTPTQQTHTHTHTHT